MLTDFGRQYSGCVVIEFSLAGDTSTGSFVSLPMAFAASALSQIVEELDIQSQRNTRSSQFMIIATTQSSTQSSLGL
jgi:hypothetical protein